MKLYPRILLLTLILASIFKISALAQAITVTNFDNSIIYSPGSSIAVPVTIGNTAGNCIAQSNTFSLYLSNSLGVYPTTPLATVSGFYITYMNGVIPAGTLPGIGYKVKVTSSSNPGATIVESAPFAIALGTGIKAAIEPTTSSPLVNDAVFGICDKVANPFKFDYQPSATATAGTSGNVVFVDETTGGTTTVNSLSGTFTADVNKNYTAIVKSSNGIIGGTKAYTIINNSTLVTLGATNTNSGCLADASSSVILNYFVDTKQLLTNYPGDTYRVSWGDGTPTSSYTICQLLASGGAIQHTYTKSSCGNMPQIGRNNVFEIDIQPNSPFCGAVGSVISTYPTITLSPQNKVTGPIGATCSGTVIFNNNSFPGEDPSAGPNACQNFAGARYTWSLDGVAKLINASLTTQFKPVLTPGNHIIELRLINNPNPQCNVDNFIYNICVQDPPKPSFTPSATLACANPGITITNTSVIDQTCTPPVFNWTVTSPTGAVPVTTTGGTDFHSFEPKFVFTTAGIYTLTLNMPDACGVNHASSTTVLDIDATPTVALSANTSYCGPQTLTFNNTAGSPTRVTYTGSGDPTKSTYTWTVTPPAGGGAATFINGTSAASQFPQISFPGFGVYTVSVNYTNSCGSPIATQTINIQQAPAVSAGPNAPVCASAGNYKLAGTILPDMSSVVSYQWRTTGDGSFDNATSSLTPVYTFGPNDKKGGTVTITIDVKTNLVGACSAISSSMALSITPLDVITSAPAKAICSGNAVNYNITALVAGSTYTWTATAMPNITGFSGGGTGSQLNDVLTNTDPLNPGVVTYTITPTGNGCPGTPFDLKVTVNPNPVLIIADITGLCSGKPTGITLDPALKYSWSSAVTSGTANGNKQQAIAVNTTGITDVLNNTGTTPAVVKYTITPISASGCPGAPVSVNVTIDPLPTQPVFATPTVALCNAATYQLTGTTPIVGTGVWKEATGKAVTFTDATNPSTLVSGLVPGVNYTFSWTISSNCAANTASLQVIDNLPSVGGTAAAAITTVCYNSSGTVTLSGQTGNVIAWQQSTDNGVNWQTLAGTNTNPSYNYTNLIQTTAFRAVVMNGNCSVANSAQVTINVNPPTIVPNAGPDQPLCNQTTTTLQGNSPGASTGQWTQKAGPTAGVVITDSTSPTTTVTGLSGGNTYTFTWTILGQPPCGNLFDDVVIFNQSAITNTVIITGSNTICAGASVNISGSTPTGGASPYTYAWESSIDNGTTWSSISGQTNQNLTVTPTVTTQYRRTVYSNLQQCSSLSNVVTINTQPVISNNTISAPNIVCYNTAPAPVTGSTPTGGDGIYFYRWQQSTDGLTFTDISGATGINYQPPVLTVTTQYRRFVNTSLCGGTGVASNTVTINTTPKLVAKFTANNQIGCAPFVITSVNVQAISDNNAQTYTWYADNAIIGTGLIFPGYTIPTEGKTVNIKLVVTSKIGCPDENFALDFSTSQQATASFTIDKTTGCGPQTITFTNTSTPLNGSTYTWKFGDGTPDYNGITPPPYTFQPDANGKDITYKVSVTANGCSPNSVNKDVTLYPTNPMPIIDPGSLTGCAPYAITVKNLTLGTNVNYDFYLFDENGIQVQKLTRPDKSDVTFNAITTTTVTKIYTVYMIATGPCGTTGKSVVYPITVAPSGISARMNVTPVNFAGEPAGCAPYLATFHNLSTGGTGYVYNIYDSNFKIIESVINNSPTATQNYNFPLAGTYYVSIGVFSNCATPIESLKTKIVVYPVPEPSFTTNVTSGCTQLAVTFKNTTPDATNAPATSYNYTWDFGDGSPTSNAFAPTHTYTFSNSPYTVTLTAVNGNGCSATTTKVEYIHVNPPPGTDFTTDVGFTASIPNYTFNFIDKSKVPGISWFWDFGDRSTSTRHNPSHTYADTGRYQVTLSTVTQFGCTDSKTYEVKVTGVPGQLYVPNAFMPTSLSPELRIFTIKGSGLKTWSMRIYNIWGQMVFETSKLSARGEPVEFWDGTFKGQDAQQGAYAWEISATFINGTDWKGMAYKGGAPKKAGTLNLIR